MIRGYVYQKGTNERVPFWVSKEQAERLAKRENGTIGGFDMKLPGYGIMDAVTWEFREDMDIPNRVQQWRTRP